jgi:hypothetical protein
MVKSFEITTDMINDAVKNKDMKKLASYCRIFINDRDESVSDMLSKTDFRNIAKGMYKRKLTPEQLDTAIYYHYLSIHNGWRDRVKEAIKESVAKHPFESIDNADFSSKSSE